MLSQNFKETVKQFVANDKAFSFMSSVKGTPAYWKKFLQEVLAMVKQLGPPTFFLTLSCADLRWNELVSIICKLKGRNMSDDEINSIDYTERCKLLNSNPVLVARHFQYRVEAFFKDIILNGPLGKTQYYAIRVEFQVRGSPHIHSFLWTKDTPSLNNDNKEIYIQHINNKISAELPCENENSELFSLVKTYQLHRHSQSCRKYQNTNCRFHFGKYFTEYAIIAEPLLESMPETDKQALLKWRKEILAPVKAFINNDLNPKKANLFDQTKENYVQLPLISKILEDLNISKQDYYRALSISCFINNYFPIGLMSWEANLDIQPVYNHYKAITYMCAYLSKSEDECSNAMNQAAKEAYKNNLEIYDKMKSIVNADVTKREVSVQEAVYLVMPELWLRKVFPGVSLANSNTPAKRFRVCLSKKEISELPEDSTAIFKRNTLDRYCDRPNTTFAKGRYQVIDGFCYAEFLRYYNLQRLNKENDSEPVELDDEIIEVNHPLTNYPKAIPLMNSSEKLRC